MALLGLWTVRGAPAAELISRSTQSSATASAGSYFPVLSEDGRFVAFLSHAPDLLVPAIGSEYLNLFLRDRFSGELSLVSVATNGSGGNGHSLAASLSADGRYVAFQSAAGNLAPADTNGVDDIFLRDTQAGTTVLVSRNLAGGTGRQPSLAPQLSSNGRWLVFESGVANLVDNDFNNASDIFLYDRQQRTTVLVSINAVGNRSRDGGSHWASMTPDGQWVAYANFTTNSPSLPGAGHVFVRNMQGGVTHWASSNAAMQFGPTMSVSCPVLSPNGSGLYFYAHNSGLTNLYRYDLGSGTTITVAAPVFGLSVPSPSADGYKVAFEHNNYVLIWNAFTMNSVTGNVSYLGELVRHREGFLRPILSADATRVTFLSGGRLTSAPTNGMVQLYQRNLALGTTTLLSADTNGATSGDLSAVLPAVTSDGRVVAFESTSTTMTPDDFNSAPDLFVREVDTGTTSLVSGRVGLPSATAFANPMPGSISADGRYVAYASHDLGPSIGDTNGVQDIFVRDVETGLVQSVSVDSVGRFTNQFHSQGCVLSADGRRVAWIMVTPGYYPSSSVHWRDLTTGETRVVSEVFANLGAYRYSPPAISADGRWVAYEASRPTHLIEPGVTDQNAGLDIILQDVEAGTNTVISRSVTGTTSGNNYSFGPRFSRDGRWLAFGSRATNLTTNQNSTPPRLFVRDLLHHLTIDVSGAPPQGQTGYTGYSAGEAVFSDDSRFLAYNAGFDYVGLYDLTSNTRTTICSRCTSPALSGDGVWVAVTALNPAAGGNRVQLFNRLSGDVSNLGTNSTRGVLTGPITRDPVLSGDGRYLIFTADPRLAYPRPGPVIYVRDLARGLTLPLPLDPQGGAGNAGAYAPQFAADGRTLVLASSASDLTPADHNSSADIFVVRIGAADSDGDGLDDDWEVAYFNDLSQGAAGDFDQDGQSNRDEFRAGTDPSNASSVLSVMVVVSLPGNDATLTWNSVTGRVYDVQYKDALEDGWLTLYANVVADSGTRSVVDNLQPRPSRRFYRVVFKP